MTHVQWMFHYEEITRAEKEKKEALNKKIKEVMDVLAEHLELVGVMANPKMGKALMEIKKMEELKEEVKEESLEDILASVPKTIQMVKRKEDSNFILPKYNKKKGITIQE